MKFKYSVVGDNTQENREWLDMLGYNPVVPTYYIDSNHWLIQTNIETNEYGTLSKESNFNEYTSVVCLGNTPLFKAVSAMRDDSDYMQWFVDELIELLTGEVNLIMCTEDDKNNMEVYTTFRKATLSELINHFK